MTVGKRLENDGVYEESLWGINMLMGNKHTNGE